MITARRSGDSPRMQHTCTPFGTSLTMPPRLVVVALSAALGCLLLTLAAGPAYAGKLYPKLGEIILPLVAGACRFVWDALARGGGGIARVSPRCLFGLLAAVASWCALGVFGVAPVFAAGRNVEARFGPDGTAGTSFEQPAALGVDQATGDVFAADYAAGSIEKFNSAHEPEAFTGVNPSIVAGRLTGFSFFTTEPESEIAVNSSSHDFYVVNNGDRSVKAFHSDGEPAEFAAGPGAGSNSIGFSEPCGVAVDSNGDIYVSDFFVGLTVYAPSGALIVASNELSFSCSLAVDSHGTVYAGRFEGAVTKFAPSDFPVTASTTYSSAGPVDENASWGIGVDPANDHLFVDEHTGVAEYDETGSRLAEFGELVASEGVAVNGALDRVYVSDAQGERQVQVFGSLVTLPEVVTGEASEVAPSAATLNGEVNPEGIALTECFFEYGETEAYGHIAACEEPNAAEIPVDSSFHAVHARAIGLRVGTTYHFRLRASNGSGPAPPGEDKPFSTPSPPAIDGATVTNLTASADLTVSADLNTKINPGGLPTTYHLEYGPTTGYGTIIPDPDRSIGDGTSDVSESQHITDLHHDELYHWRVVASNAAGTTTGVDHTFIYSTSGEGLPDGRAYEMVTPPNKNAALIGDIFLGMRPDIAQDGSHVILVSLQCFADAPSCVVNRTAEGTPYEFSRTAEGWTSHALAPSARQFEESTVRNANADTGGALFSIPTAPLGQDDFYLRRPEDGSFTDVGPVTAPELGAVGPGGGVLNNRATADFAQVVFQQGKAVWPFDLSKGESLYEYVGVGNHEPILVGVRGAAGSLDLISRCGTTLAGVVSAARAYALAADGQTVFFAPERCEASLNGGAAVPANELWARVGLSESVEVSQSTCGGGPQSPEEMCRNAEAQPADAEFAGASLDGSRLFFTSTQQLTDDASEDGTSTDTALGEGCTATTSANGCNLYEASLARNREHHVVLGGLRAVSAGGSGSGGPRVQGVVAISNDGSRVFFVARDVLSPAANDQGAVARDGAENLYVSERDATHPGGVVRFIATLAETERDEVQWKSQLSSANLTPDGRFLLFTSQAPLTRDDTRTVGGAAQVFRYDAASGSLVRISVGEASFNDNGNTGSGDAQIALAALAREFAGSQGHSAPSMSADGSRVFFMSPIGLTRSALDDVPIGKNSRGEVEYAQNVYEYHDGHVSLISDGRDTSVLPQPSCTLSGGTISAVCLIGADPSGKDVFFTTADQLVRADTDTQLDFYDARICASGDPCVQATASAPPPCGGEACHGTPAATPGVPVAPTAAFNGQGNLVPQASKPPPRHKARPKRCRRHFIRRHHRCVKAKHVRRAPRSSQSNRRAAR
jgi:hypothetical protein